MQLIIELPDNLTIGDLTAASGAILKASTEYVDWEGLHKGEADSVGKPGVVLLDIARQLDRASS